MQKYVRLLRNILRQREERKSNMIISDLTFFLIFGVIGIFFIPIFFVDHLVHRYESREKYPERKLENG